jgi:hypothetical protein
MATSTVTNTYAKYAPKNTKQQVNWAKLAYNDPYFSLGYMAGSTLADNYNKRGEQKILENAAASLNGFEPTVTPEQQAQALDQISIGDASIPSAQQIAPLQDNQAAQKAWEQSMQNDANIINGTPGATGAIGISGNTAPAAAAAQQQPTIAIGSTDYQQDPRMQVLDQLELEQQIRNGQQPGLGISGNGFFQSSPADTANANGVGGAAVDTSPEAIIPSNFQLRQAQELQQVGNALQQSTGDPAVQQMLNTVNAGGNIAQPVAPAPATDQQQQSAAAASQLPPPQPVPKQGPNERMEFDKTKWLMQQRLAMLKDGFDEDRIAKTMSTLEMMADSYEAKVNEHNTQLDLKDLLTADPTTAQFQEKIVQLSKDNPKAANLFLKNAVFYPTLWENEQWYKKNDHQFAQKEKFAKENLQNTKNLAKFNMQINKELARYKTSLGVQAEQQKIANRVFLISKLYPNATPEQVVQIALGRGTGSSRGGLTGSLKKQPKTIAELLRQTSVAYGDTTVGEDPKPSAAAKGKAIGAIGTVLKTGKTSPDEIYQYLSSIENNLSPDEISYLIDAAVRQTGIGTWNGPPEAETPAQPSPGGGDSSGGFFSWLQKAGDNAYKSIYGDRPDPTQNNIYRLKMSEWTQALQYNQQAGDQGLDKEGMMEAARKRYGNDLAKKLFNDTDWEAFGL